METIIIKRSRKDLGNKMGISVLLMIVLFGFNTSLYKSSPLLFIFLSIICGSFFLYYLIELIINKAAIIIAADGITIQNKGWYSWAYVKAFWVVIIKEPASEQTNTEYITARETLYIRLHDTTVFDINITNMNPDRPEIIQAMLSHTKEIYQGTFIEQK